MEIVKRERTNQPLGYYGNNHNNDLIIEYYCEKHNYFYYPESWTYEKKRKHYEKGYYDENGKYYPSLILSENGVYSGDLICPKCKTVNKELIWSEDALPSCKKCGKNIADDIEKIECDKLIKKVETYNTRKHTTVFIVRVIGIALAIIIAVFAIILLMANMDIVDIPGLKEKITEPQRYIPEVGRNCKYVEQFEGYFDPETDCIFKGVKTKSGEEWTYWIYGVSENYGKYGWIKYDVGNDVFYVEVSKDSWQQLPKENDIANILR